MKAVFVLVLVFVGCHGFGIEPESTHQNENRGFLGGIFETGIFETVGEAVGGISEAVGQTLGIVSCKSGSVGQTCSIGCKCSGDNTCEAGSQKCRAPGTAGDSCHLTRPCGSGLTCEAGSQKCRKAGEWRDSCHLTRPCGPGLSCQPGVHKCYNSPRKFGEPCVAGYGCGYGLKCHHTVHKCTVEGIAACDKAMGALGVSIGAPLAVGATCFFSAGTLCAGAAKIGAKVVSKSAKIMVKSFVECKEEADKIHPGIDIPYSTPASCFISSQSDCEAAASSRGLELGGGGYEFADDHSTKGCYFYASGTYENMAFFGTGGSTSQMQSSVSSPKTRMECEAPCGASISSQSDCEAAASSRGLELGGGGYEFADDHSTKGCYFYASGTYENMAFFGTGGSTSQMQSSVSSPKTRMECEDP